MFTRIVILHLISFVSICNAASEECSYVDYLGKEFNITEVGCPSNNICNEQRVVKVTYIEMPLYFYKEMKNFEKNNPGDLQKPVHQLLRRCCGTCANIKQVKILKNMGEVTLSSMNGSDSIYPILSTASKEKKYGYYYIPFVDIPGMMYISEPTKGSLFDLLQHVFPICASCRYYCL